eukprot:7242989-Prymnesium_polylepis.1
MPGLVFCSAVEHLRRWSAVLGRHGLLLLEVHLLDVKSTHEQMSGATNLHFDALQAWSGQMLLPAKHWAAAAAAAGLSSADGERLQYPKDGEYTRIVLQRLLPCPLVIRLAVPSDMPSLSALESFQPPGLQADRARIERRIAQFAAGQYVAVDGASGELVGAVYTQLLSAETAVLTCAVESELDLHVPGGSV